MWLNIDLTKRITKGNNEKKIQIRYLKKNDNIMTTAISDTNLNPNINLHLPMILKFNITNKTNQSNIITVSPIFNLFGSDRNERLLFSL